MEKANNKQSSKSGLGYFVKNLIAGIAAAPVGLILAAIVFPFPFGNSGLAFICIGTVISYFAYLMLIPKTPGWPAKVVVALTVHFIFLAVLLLYFLTLLAR